MIWSEDYELWYVFAVTVCFYMPTFVRFLAIKTKAYTRVKPTERILMDQENRLTYPLKALVLSSLTSFFGQRNAHFISYYVNFVLVACYW